MQNSCSPPLTLSPAPKYRLIAIDRITLPTRPSDFLYESLINTQELELMRRFGQIRPFLVCHQAEKYALLTGLADFLAAQVLGMGEVTCRLLAAETPAINRYCLRILHDRPALEQSPILQAYLLHEAKEHLRPKEVLTLLPLLGLKEQPYQLTERLALLQLSPQAQGAIHEGWLALKCAKQLLAWPQHEQDQALALIAAHQFGFSKQYQLVEMLQELCLRQNCGIEELLRPWRRQQAACQVENGPQEGQRLLSHLQRSCSPAQSEAEDAFAHKIAALKAPTQIRFNHSPSFEEDWIELRMRFSNWDELQGCWPHVQRLLETKRLER